jgi:hypothetical protein
LILKSRQNSHGEKLSEQATAVLLYDPAAIPGITVFAESLGDFSPESLQNLKQAATVSDHSLFAGFSC